MKTVSPAMSVTPGLLYLMRSQVESCGDCQTGERHAKAVFVMVFGDDLTYHGDIDSIRWPPERRNSRPVSPAFSEEPPCALAIFSIP